MRTTLDAPGGECGWLNLEEGCRLVLGEEDGDFCRTGTATLIDAHLPALPFIERRISASMKVSLGSAMDE